MQRTLQVTIQCKAEKHLNFKHVRQNYSNEDGTLSQNYNDMTSKQQVGFQPRSSGIHLISKPVNKISQKPFDLYINSFAHINPTKHN